MVSWATRGREKENVSEGDHATRQEAKRRLDEPEGDHELHSAMEVCLCNNRDV